MSNPIVSIIVPTRERCATLEYALQSLVAQDCDGLEILVSDNASTDATREVVEAQRDPRVRYVNTGQRVDMSANWEFALQQARGDYICYLGDDDAFVPGGIATALRLLRESGADCVGWRAAHYCWPDHSLSSMRGRLHLVCREPAYLRHTAEVWQTFQQGKGYKVLFQTYQSGVIPRNVLLEQARRHGRCFRATNPDLISAIFATRALRSQVYVDWPLSVAGYAGQSNGSSFFSANLWRPREAMEGEGKRFLDEIKQTPWNRRLVGARSLRLSEVDAWLSAEEGPDGEIPDDGKAILSTSLPWVIREAANFPQVAREELLAAVRETAIRNGVQQAIEPLLAGLKPGPEPVLTDNAVASGVEFNELTVTVRDPQSLPDVAAAARWVGHLAPGDRLMRSRRLPGWLVFWAHRLRRWGTRGVSRFLR